MGSSYMEFLLHKLVKAPECGFEVGKHTLNNQLFPFQRDIVHWALRRGRAAIFADCGLGKTPMQLEWARRVHERSGGNILILAPLAVAAQTKREGEKFGVHVTVCRTQGDVRKGVNIANYEMLPHFSPDGFDGIVLDESSILKAYDGKTRQALTDFAQSIPYRLACTATPAPNDTSELINHAEFLQIMQGKEILALFFTQDGNTSHQWRLKGHAREAFWKWLASWACALRKPSDLGYSDEGFCLPPLHVHQRTVHSDAPPDGSLFVVEAQSLLDRRNARRSSINERVQECAGLVNGNNERWVVWCDLNAESEAIKSAIPDAVEVRGSDTPEYKEKALRDFTEGHIRVLVTKPTIAGHGLNWQHCARMAFVGLSDSWEQYYQAMRRCWRFGQTRPVECYIITCDTEGSVVKNIERKEKQASEMFDNLTRNMAAMSLGRADREEMAYEEDEAHGRGWRLLLGDCVERMADVKSDSVGLTVFSPPFPGMYAYTNSAHDMGNVRDIDDMIGQFKFLIPELLRVTMPGRHCCVHLTQSVAFKGRDGYIGIKDFRGRVISAMEDAGWIYYGEVCIDKDPQVKAIRTKARGLLFKTLNVDSSHMHMALADYLLQFRKPGENAVPIRAGSRDNQNGWITAEEWIEWAAPVWYRASEYYPGGIRETDVLNVAQARETDDERHLCPLQLGVIERAVKLWSAPGETILSPFAGIGSEGVVALKSQREFIGIELKRSYYESAMRNLRQAESVYHSGDLFMFAEDSEEVA